MVFQGEAWKAFHTAEAARFETPLAAHSSSSEAARTAPTVLKWASRALAVAVPTPFTATSVQE